MDVRVEPKLAVEAVGLTKRYPLTWKRKVLVALDHLNLEIKAGEVFGLLGPNGSGKSTTMKLLLGLIRPSAGEARVFGEPPGTLAALKRVGFLPENPYFYAFLNGDETLRFYGKLAGMTGARLEARIEELIELVGLQNGRERPLRSYSKGMLQRIGLAQAMMHDPDLLFLDEPTAGVDPLGSAQIRDLILKLKQMGKTVIFSSHLLEQVEEVSDRVAIFSLGKKVLEGSLDTLLTENEGVEVHLPHLSPEQQDRHSRGVTGGGGGPGNGKVFAAEDYAGAALPADGAGRADWVVDGGGWEEMRALLFSHAGSVVPTGLALFLGDTRH
jgi:ABC-2 type transport system ATP-binding protein